MNRIDKYAPTFDSTETRVALVDADPDTVLAGIERLDLATAVGRAIEAFGVADRLALAPTRIDAAGHAYVYGLVWRLDGGPAEDLDAHDLRGFDRPGYVKLVWDVRVVAGGQSGTLLSTTTRVVATDGESLDQLGGAWDLFSMASTALSKRALTDVKRYAEGERVASGCHATLPLAA